MLDRLLPGDAELLARHFAAAPALTGVVLRSMRFERRGPGCTLRVDLPGPVQCNLGFLAVEDVTLTGGGRLPAPVSISSVPRPLARMAVSVVGPSLRLSLTCAAQIRLGRVSTHTTPPDAIDTGPHVFDSKVDQRLYVEVPGAEVDRFHERF